MKEPQEGLVFKTSRISYIHNYFLAVIMVFLFYLLWYNFNFMFTLTPRTSNELFSSMFILLFLIVITFLIEEPVIERILRHYIVTNNEVIKVEGILRKKKISIPYQSVADVKVEQGIVGRIFNFGNVYVTGVVRSEETGKTESIRMKGVRRPNEVYRVIQNKINLMRGAVISRGLGTKEKE